LNSHLGNARELTREEIEGLVSDAQDATVVLSRIVMLIGNHFETDVCSAYLFEQDVNELVLAATVGLQQECIGQIRMHLDEGLAGLVAQTGSPVAVENASEHPRFKHFPETGEDAFHSFLGVPLFDQGRLCGVLVVQTVSAREFTSSEIAMLAATANVVAPLINGASSGDV